MGKTRIEYEQKYYQEGYQYIVGLDEAGRGPMAGELVVAGVVFPKDYYNVDIYDSKQLCAKKREALYALILDEALFYHIEIVSIEDVDRLNVYQASKIAMEKCAKALWQEGMFALSDAMPLDDIAHLPIIKGDDASMSIAAASILAKVTRDHLMIKHATKHPEYGFDKHKGYVTKMHKERLTKYGVCPIHRKSFTPVKEQLKRQLVI